jgi:hypothetical protein
MNRFHNKYHRQNHHTSETIGDVDSSHDPIASPEHPFLGSFTLSGDLVISGGYHILGCDATSTSTGVVRFATADEVSELSATNVCLSPADLVVPYAHQLSMSAAHTDVEVSFPLNSGQALVYNGSKWVNASVEGITYAMATSAQAFVVSELPPSGVAMNPRLVRQMLPIHIDLVGMGSLATNSISAPLGTITNAVSSIFGVMPPPNTLIFAKWAETFSYGVGNGTAWGTRYNTSIYVATTANTLEFKSSFVDRAS